MKAIVTDFRHKTKQLTCGQANERNGFILNSESNFNIELKPVSNDFPWR
jgi:hypothetical protein